LICIFNFDPVCYTCLQQAGAGPREHSRQAKGLKGWKPNISWPRPTVWVKNILNQLSPERTEYIICIWYRPFRTQLVLPFHTQGVGLSDLCLGLRYNGAHSPYFKRLRVCFILSLTAAAGRDGLTEWENGTNLIEWTALSPFSLGEPTVSAAKRLGIEVYSVEINLTAYPFRSSWRKIKPQ